MGQEIPEPCRFLPGAVRVQSLKINDAAEILDGLAQGNEGPLDRIAPQLVCDIGLNVQPGRPLMDQDDLLLGAINDGFRGERFATVRRHGPSRLLRPAAGGGIAQIRPWPGYPPADPGWPQTGRAMAPE